MDENKTTYADFANAVSDIMHEADHLRLFYGDSTRYLYEPKCLYDMFVEDGADRFTDTLVCYYPLLNDFLNVCNGYMPPSLKGLWEVLTSIEHDADIAQETMTMDFENCFFVVEQYDKETGEAVSREQRFTYTKHYEALEKIRVYTREWYGALSGFYGNIVEAANEPTQPPTAATAQPSNGGSHKRTTEPKQRGRKTKPFVNFFVRNTKQTDYDKVKALCDNKQGKDLALVILVAIKQGIMLKPTFRTIEKDCKDIGSESGFAKYMNMGLQAYTPIEIEGMKRLLEDRCTL